jgi:hypothetical protein
MSEIRGQYNVVGGMRIYDSGEVFNIRIDYLELDLDTGQTEQKQFFAEALAKDASGAIVHALQKFNQSQPANAKIWQMSVTAEIGSDELRDRLRDTLPEQHRLSKGRNNSTVDS